MPLLGVKPADIVLVTETTDPVDLFYDNAGPHALVGGPFLAGQPHDAVAMDTGEAARDVLGVGLVLGDLLEVADETQAGQVCGRQGLVVRQVDVLVPPREGQGDVGAGLGVQRRRRDGQRQHRRVAAGLLTRRDVLGQADRGVGHVRRDPRRGDVLGEDGRHHAGLGQRQQSSAQHGRLIAGWAEDGGSLLFDRVVVHLDGLSRQYQLRLLMVDGNRLDRRRQ